MQAFLRETRISTRKARLVADAIRNMEVNRALDVLYLSRKRAAHTIAQTLRSAVANAAHSNMRTDGLYIARIEVNEGPALKRFHPSTRGRVHQYKKRSSHIRIILAEKKPAVVAEKKADTNKKDEKQKTNKTQQEGENK